MKIRFYFALFILTTLFFGGCSPLGYTVTVQNTSPNVSIGSYRLKVIVHNSSAYAVEVYASGIGTKTVQPGAIEEFYYTMGIAGFTNYNVSKTATLIAKVMVDKDPKSTYRTFYYDSMNMREETWILESWMFQ